MGSVMFMCLHNKALCSSVPFWESYFLPLAFSEETDITKIRGCALGEDMMLNIWGFFFSVTEKRLDRLTYAKHSTFITQISANKKNQPRSPTDECYACFLNFCSLFQLRMI